MNPQLTYEEKLLRAGKKMHWRRRVKHPFFDDRFDVKTACKVENRTYAYVASTNKTEVTCIKCKLAIDGKNKS